MSREGGKVSGSRSVWGALVRGRRIELEPVEWQLVTSEGFERLSASSRRCLEPVSEELQGDRYVAIVMFPPEFLDLVVDELVDEPTYGMLEPVGGWGF